MTDPRLSTSRDSSEESADEAGSPLRRACFFACSVAWVGVGLVVAVALILKLLGLI